MDKYIKGRNYRIRELASGDLQIENRSTLYGYNTKRLPKSIALRDAHIYARNILMEMANAIVLELVINGSDLTCMRY